MASSGMASMAAASMSHHRIKKKIDHLKLAEIESAIKTINGELGIEMEFANVDDCSKLVPLKFEIKHDDPDFEQKSLKLKKLHELAYERSIIMGIQIADVESGKPVYKADRFNVDDLKRHFGGNKKDDKIDWVASMSKINLDGIRDVQTKEDLASIVFESYEPTIAFEEYELATKVKGLAQLPIEAESSLLSSGWVCYPMYDNELANFLSGFKLRHRLNQKTAKRWNATQLHLSTQSAINFLNFTLLGKSYVDEVDSLGKGFDTTLLFFKPDKSLSTDVVDSSWRTIEGKANYITLPWEHEMSEQEMKSVTIVNLEHLGFGKLRAALEERWAVGEVLRLYGQFIETNRYGIDSPAALSILSFETVQLIECTSTAFFEKMIDNLKVDDEISETVKGWQSWCKEDIKERASMASMGNAVFEVIKYIELKKASLALALGSSSSSGQ